MKPFSKLKKQIENLFDPALNMQVCCQSFPIRSQRGSSSIPRFYVKLGKEYIWDFPKDFNIKDETFYTWKDDNKISELVRTYIDAPLEGLLEREFPGDKVDFSIYNPDTRQTDIICINYRLTELFKAADRRLGKEKLINWALFLGNSTVDMILQLRFSYNREEEVQRYIQKNSRDKGGLDMSNYYLCRGPLVTYEMMRDMDEEEKGEFKKAEENIRRKF